MHNTSLSSNTVINRGPQALPENVPGEIKPRDQLIFSGTIHSLMAADIDDILRDSAEGMVTVNDLKDKGWTRAQIDRHAATVFANRVNLLSQTAADDNGADDMDPPDPVATQGEASRNAPTPGPSRPAGPSPEAEPTVAATLHNHLTKVLDGNDAVCVRMDMAVQNMNIELLRLRSHNAHIRHVIASLEQANT